jgi:putative holliday junction resolvase
MPRILAIDYGERNVGIAISDKEKIIAFPRETRFITNMDDFLIIINEYLENEEIEAILIGVPYSLDKKITPQTKSVLECIKVLREHVTVDIIEFDERYTSKQADNIISRSRKNFRKNDQHMIAAQIMLDTHLSKIINE